MAKQDAKPKIFQWVLLLQEFVLEIKDKKGSKNLVVNHLSHIETSIVQDGEIYEEFSDEKIFSIASISPITYGLDISWFDDFANFLARNYLL